MGAIESEIPCPHGVALPRFLQPVYYAAMRASRGLILPVYLPTLLLTFCDGMLLPLLPIYVSSFDVSYGLIGLVLAGAAIGRLLADVPAGTFLESFDRKWAMVLGVLLVAFSALALVWAQSVWELLGYRLLSGVGGAMWNLSRHAYLAEKTEGRGRGRAIALFGGITRLGSFAGPVVGGLVATAFGMHAAFALYGGLGVVTAVMAALFVERTEAVGGPLRSPAYQLWDVLRGHRGVLVTAGLGQLLAQMTRAGRQVIVPLYGSDILGLGVDTIGLIIGLSSFLDMAMFYPAGWVMDRWGRKFAIVPSFALQALGMLLVPLSGGAAGLLGATALAGFGNGLSSGSMMTLGADLAPVRSPGPFLGVWRLIGDGGSTGAPLVVGALAGVLSLGLGAVVVGAVGLLAAGVFAFGVPETLARSPRKSLSDV